MEIASPVSSYRLAKVPGSKVETVERKKMVGTFLLAGNLDRNFPLLRFCFFHPVIYNPLPKSQPLLLRYFNSTCYTSRQFQPGGGGQFRGGHSPRGAMQLFAGKTCKDTRCIPLEKWGDGPRVRERERVQKGVVAGMSPRWSREFSRKAKEGVKTRVAKTCWVRKLWARWAASCGCRDCRESRDRGKVSRGEAETKWLALAKRLSKLAKSSLEPTAFRFFVAFSCKMRFLVEETGVIGLLFIEFNLRMAKERFHLVLHPGLSFILGCFFLQQRCFGYGPGKCADLIFTLF